MNPAAKTWIETAVVAAVAALCFVGIGSLIPFAEGRDTGTYYLYFRDLFKANPEFPILMLFRTPFTPVFFGIAYQVLGELGAKLALGGGYVLMAVLCYRILATYSRWVAVPGVLLIFANLELFELFNSPASEGPQAILIVAWAAIAFFAVVRPSKSLGLALGLLTFLLVLNRPANQLLIGACLLPACGFLVRSTGRFWSREGLIAAAIAVCSAVGLTAGYMTYNWVRYDQFGVARLGGASVPFFRMFLQERLIRPENGPRSAELADLARRRVLTDETFQKYGIDEETFFRFATIRMFDALFRASVEERGWDNDFRLFRDAAWEVMAADPKEFWLCYVDGVAEMFHPDRRPFRFSASTKRFREFREEQKRRYEMYEEQGLPVPGEGDLITATGWWLAAIPAETVLRPERPPWFKPARWTFRPRPPPPEELAWLWDFSRRISVSWIYLAVGLVGTGLSFIQGRGDARLFCIAAACLLVVLATLFGVLLKFYRIPFDPVFTIFFCYGIFACWQFIRLEGGRLLAFAVKKLARHPQ